MNTVEVTLTEEQRSNLEKLARYLESLPKDYEHFGMSTFLSAKGEDESDPSSESIREYMLKNGGVEAFACGAVACAVGHGPAAGVLVPEDMVSRQTHIGADGTVHIYDVTIWNAYAMLFCGNSNPYVFSFLFSGAWSVIDDHHWGAAARIRYVLDTGSCGAGVGLGAVREYAPYRITKRRPLPKKTRRTPTSSAPARVHALDLVLDRKDMT